jgi:hypothetical protein
MWRARCARSNVWIATIEERSAARELTDLFPVQTLPGTEPPFARLAARLSNRDFAAAAIDAPFSLPHSVADPDPHANLLARVGSLPRPDARPFAHGHALIELFLPGQSTRGAKIYRETEQHWREKGLNVRSTMWAGPRGGAPMTVACMTLLHAARAISWPWNEPGRPVVAEAFPGAQLVQWGLPHQRYSQGDEIARANRTRIATALSDRLEIPDRRRQLLIENADALDAVLCGISAVGVSYQRLESLPSDLSKSEGWIAVHE